MKKGTLRQILVIAGTLATFAINILDRIRPINGLTTGQISDMFQVFFVPAGYVFAIWGIIYLGLLAYTIYQALPQQRDNATLDRVGWLYVGTCVANSIWLVLWHYQIYWATVVFMLALLIPLIMTYLALGTGRTPTSTGTRWFVRVPFSIYLGWITVATVANFTTFFSDLGWGNGYDTASAIWAAIMLVVATVVAVLMSVRHGDIAYIAVIVWAFVGIAVKHSGTVLVAGTAWAMAAVAALSLAVGVPRARKRLSGG